jgi:hypothetical protein
MAGAGDRPSSTSSLVPAPPPLATAGSVSVLVGPQARADKQQEAELRNLHLMEPDDTGTEAGYEEDDEGEDEEEEDEGPAAVVAAAAVGEEEEEEEEGVGKGSSLGNDRALPPRMPGGRVAGNSSSSRREDGNDGEEQRRQPWWGRQLSLRRGFSASSMPSVSSFASLEELMERGTMGP